MSLREVRGVSWDTRSGAIYDVRRKYCNELVIPQRMDEHSVNGYLRGGEKISVKGPGIPEGTNDLAPRSSNRASRIWNWPVESGDALYGAYWVAGRVNESGDAGRKVSRGVIHEAEIDGKQRRGGQAKSAGGERKTVGGASRYEPPRPRDSTSPIGCNRGVRYSSKHETTSPMKRRRWHTQHTRTCGTERRETHRTPPARQQRYLKHDSRLDEKEGREKGARKGGKEERTGLNYPHPLRRAIEMPSVVSRIFQGRMKFATDTAHPQSVLKHVLARCIHRLARSHNSPRNLIAWHWHCRQTYVKLKRRIKLERGSAVRRQQLVWRAQTDRGAVQENKGQVDELRMGYSPASPSYLYPCPRSPNLRGSLLSVSVHEYSSCSRSIIDVEKKTADSEGEVAQERGDCMRCSSKNITSVAQSERAQTCAVLAGRKAVSRKAAELCWIRETWQTRWEIVVLAAQKGSGTVFVGSQKNYKKYAEKGKRKGRERGNVEEFRLLTVSQLPPKWIPCSNLHRVLNSITIQILVWKREIAIIWPASGQDLCGNEKLQQLQSLPPRNLRDNDRSGHATNADKMVVKGVICGNFARIRVQIVTEDHVRVEAVPKRMLNAGSNIMRGWICICLVLS
ncbi:hypothetical protein B0H14DRAFT_2640634 [Mycena olivaceomarginata]|nr:hypothetical protein B0H14DRAFT_2640634 [Mycena olivaceomarginata]